VGTDTTASQQASEMGCGESMEDGAANKHEEDDVESQEEEEGEDSSGSDSEEEEEGESNSDSDSDSGSSSGGSSSEEDESDYDSSDFSDTDSEEEARMKVAYAIMDDTYEFWRMILKEKVAFGMAFYKLFILENSELTQLFEGSMDVLAERFMDIVGILFEEWDDPDEQAETIERLSSLGGFHWRIGVPERAFGAFADCFIRVIRNRYWDVQEHIVDDIEHRFLKASLAILSNYGKGNTIKLHKGEKSVAKAGVSYASRKAGGIAERTHREKIVI